MVWSSVHTEVNTITKNPSISPHLFPAARLIKKVPIIATFDFTCIDWRSVINY